MPNHITTDVEISGTPEQIKALVEKTKLKEDVTLEEGNKFDFNGIVKMPEVLLDTVSPPQIVLTEEEATEINEAAKKAREEKPNQYDNAYYRAMTGVEQARRIKKYGAVSWYDWSSRNWGTKWNAYKVRYLGGDANKIVLSLQTAWDTPRGIWRALEEQSYTVKGVCYGEMDGFEHFREGAADVWDAYEQISVEYIG